MISLFTNNRLLLEGDFEDFSFVRSHLFNIKEMRNRRCHEISSKIPMKAEEALYLILSVIFIFQDDNFNFPSEWLVEFHHFKLQVNKYMEIEEFHEDGLSVDPLSEETKSRPTSEHSANESKSMETERVDWFTSGYSTTDTDTINTWPSKPADGQFSPLLRKLDSVVDKGMTNDINCFVVT